MTPSAMGEVPIELARLAIERPRLQRALSDPDHRQQLAVVAGREDLVSILEIGIAQRRLDHAHARITQELDGAIARDAGKERSVGGGRVDHPVLPKNTFAEPSSATLPSMSHIRQFSKPRACASLIARAL